MQHHWGRGSAAGAHGAPRAPWRGGGVGHGPLGRGSGRKRLGWWGYLHCLRRLSTVARASRLGTWEETRTAAARVTEASARNCGELGAGSSNVVGTELQTAVVNWVGVVCSPRRHVEIDNSVGGRGQRRPAWRPPIVEPTAYR